MYLEGHIDKASAPRNNPMVATSHPVPGACIMWWVNNTIVHLDDAVDASSLAILVIRDLLVADMTVWRVMMGGHAMRACA